MPDTTLRLGWAVDFMDSPAEGLDFRYWSGHGDLTIGTGTDAINYQGTNGVITIEPPREASGEAVRMSIEMDASDSAVRERLRTDIGPLRVRVRWLYYASTLSEEVSRTMPQALTVFTTEVVVPITGLAAETTAGEVYMMRVTDTGGSGALNTDDTYWIRILNNIGDNYKSFAIFRTKAEAEAANNNNYATGGGRLNITPVTVSNLTIRIIDQEGGQETNTWMMTGKEFQGRLSSPVLEGSTYKVDIESLISDIDRGRVLNWSNDMQQGRYPDDKGMEYIKDYAEGIDTKWPPS